jgi:hypothetical protein
MFNKAETTDKSLLRALSFFEQSKFDDALVRFEERLEDAKEDGEIKIQLFCYYGLAKIALLQKQLKEYHKQAESVLEQLEEQSAISADEFRLWSRRLRELKKREFKLN